MRWHVMSEISHLLEQAERCRRLAKGIDDERTAAMLRRMADDFERKAADLTNQVPPPVQR